MTAASIYAYAANNRHTHIGLHFPRAWGQRDTDGFRAHHTHSTHTYIGLTWSDARTHSTIHPSIPWKSFINITIILGLTQNFFFSVRSFCSYVWARNAPHTLSSSYWNWSLFSSVFDFRIRAHFAKLALTTLAIYTRIQRTSWISTCNTTVNVGEEVHNLSSMRFQCVSVKQHTKRSLWNWTPNSYAFVNDKNKINDNKSNKLCLSFRQLTFP